MARKDESGTKFQEVEMLRQCLKITTVFIGLSIVMFLSGLIGLREGIAASADLTRMHSGGGVTVSVTHLNPKDSDGPRFQVALNTHSVDLDAYDLKELSSLRDKAGNVFKPSEVENKGGGHHREVILIFANPSVQAGSLELVIRDIAGVKERVFRWGPWRGKS